MPYSNEDYPKAPKKKLPLAPIEVGSLYDSTIQAEESRGFNEKQKEAKTESIEQVLQNKKAKLMKAKKNKNQALIKYYQSEINRLEGVIEKRKAK